MGRGSRADWGVSQWLAESDGVNVGGWDGEGDKEGVIGMGGPCPPASPKTLNHRNTTAQGWSASFPFSGAMMSFKPPRSRRPPRPRPRPRPMSAAGAGAA